MTTTSLPQRSIDYDPITKDFRLTLGGELVGFARTHHEGERELDRLAYDVLTRTATELDGGDVEVQTEVEAARVWEQIGACYVCGAAGWAAGGNDPLCPDHAGVLREYQEQRVVYARPAEEVEPVGVRGIESHCTKDDPCWQHDPCPAHAELAAQTLADSRPIPRCGDCEAALGDYGRCEDCDDRAAGVSWGT